MLLLDAADRQRAFFDTQHKDQSWKRPTARISVFSEFEDSLEEALLSDLLMVFQT